MMTEHHVSPWAFPHGFRWGRTVVGLLCSSSVAAGAAVLGYHDSSDPVKTVGWVCSTESQQPLRVHMYAEGVAGRQLLATRIADARRDDLASVCSGGTAHAFRFGDYAATADGAALYSSTAPVAIHVMAETPDGLVELPGSPRAVSFAPVGIWDADLADGRWRTDRDNQLEGTGAFPLLLGDCASDATTAGLSSAAKTDVATGCRFGPTTSASSNAASSESAWPQQSFWAVIANVENAFDNPACVDGPPGQSRVIRAPGGGELFGLIVLPDGEADVPVRRKMHLVLNSTADEACRTRSYGIPHLSFGAQTDRGNNGVLTYLNSAGAKTVLRFGMTLMDIADRRPDAFPQPADGAQRASEAQFVVEAIWGGRKRWLIVEVLPDPRGAPAENAMIDAHVQFKWSLVNSFLYPGAEYVYKSAAVISDQCAPEGVAIPTMDRRATYVDVATRGQSRQDYALDLQKAFACLDRLGAWGDEPMPAHAIPITGVHFGIGQDDVFYRNGNATERRAPNAIWIAVDGVRLE